MKSKSLRYIIGSILAILTVIGIVLGTLNSWWREERVVLAPPLVVGPSEDPEVTPPIEFPGN